MNINATNKYNLQTQVLNLLTKLMILVRDSARNQPADASVTLENLLALGRRNRQTILLQEICIEIENARGFTTNEIAKIQHVKFNPRSTERYTGAKVGLQHLISSYAASRGNNFRCGN